MEGYEVGQRPPGLADDGSFDTPLGVRTQSIIDDEGQILIIDRKTGVLIVDPESEG